jgi:hypothetical protein
LQLFEEALALSDDQCSDAGPSGSLLDNFSSPANLLSGSGFSGSSFAAPEGMPFSSAMERILSQASSSPASVPSASALTGSLQGTVFPAAGDFPRPFDNHSTQTPPAAPSLLSQPATGSVLNKSRLSEWMDAHALTRSSHHCAMYCRMGMEAAGLNTADRPQTGDAGDYGPFLLRHGAQVIPPESYVPQVGDVVVFDKTSQHPSGHIEMYDGHRWVSDFMQNSFSPYRDAENTPPFTIYRLT